MAHDVFISYSSKDKPIADGICARMEADGLRCWIAPRDIDSGQDWPTAIANGMAGSKVMVLVFSESSNISEDVSRELYLAANNKVVIIPFVIENVKPEAGKAYYLGRTHWLDAMNPPTDEQIARLIERVHSIMKPAKSIGSVAHVREFGQRVHRKRPWVIPAVLVFIAALIIGGISYFPKIMATFFPVGLSENASVDPSFYLHREDFNNPAYDGGLPPEWGPGPCPDITLTQGNGSLVFRTQADVLPGCSIGPGSWYTMSQVKALEFAISISPEMQAAPASFAFFMNGADEPGKNGRLGVNCGLNGSQSGCMVRTEQDQLYQTRRFTATPGTIYTFRIEILDPDQMAFRFVLNGETIGEFTMAPADVTLYKDLFFHVAGGTVQMGGRATAGAYLLDYLAIEQR